MYNNSIQKSDATKNTITNSSINFSDMSAITDTPLNNEETALYTTVYTSIMKKMLESAVKSICVAQSEAITNGFEKIINTLSTRLDDFMDEFKTYNKNQTSQSDLITNLINTQNETTKSLINAIDKAHSKNLTNAKDSSANSDSINSRLLNSFSEKESSNWIKDVWSACKIIGKRCNKDKQRVLFDVYDIVKKSHPYLKDDYKDYKSYNPGSSQISMCGHSDYYRPIIEDATSELHKKYFPEKYGVTSIAEKGDVNSVSIMKSPSVMTDLINSYSKKHNITRHSAIYKLYTSLSDMLSVDLVVGRNSYANSLGYKNCSTAYYVANNDKLFSAFKTIAEK